jgi:hypothetical protein
VVILAYKAAAWSLWYLGLALYWPGMKLQEWALVLKGRWDPDTRRKMAVMRAIIRRTKSEIAGVE